MFQKLKPLHRYNNSKKKKKMISLKESSIKKK